MVEVGNEVYASPKNMKPKVNVIAQLWIEIAYY